jgi:hypothetical protein
MASVEVLERRARYGGRKGRSAARKLRRLAQFRSRLQWSWKLAQHVRVMEERDWDHYFDKVQDTEDMPGPS